MNWETVWSIAGTVISIAISLGVLKWLVEKAKDAKIVRQLHAESLIDWGAQALATWAQSKKGLTGQEQSKIVQEGLEKKFGIKDEIEKQVKAEVGYKRMKAAEANPLASSPTAASQD